MPALNWLFLWPNILGHSEFLKTLFLGYFPPITKEFGAAIAAGSQEEYGIWDLFVCYFKKSFIFFFFRNNTLISPTLSQLFLKYLFERPRCSRVIWSLQIVFYGLRFCVLRSLKLCCRNMSSLIMAVLFIMCS